MGFPADMDFGTATAVSSTRRPLTAARASPSRLAALLPHPLTVVCWGLATVSETNVREHHMARYRRTKKQQKAVFAALMDYRGLLEMVGNEVRDHGGRVRVILTRQAPRRLDDGDNANTSLKHVRDAVAEMLGTGDGVNSGVAWKYGEQRVGHPAVVITLECVN